MDTLDVACAVEGDYVPHSAAMLHSVIAHWPGEVRVHYLHGPGQAGDTAPKLEAMVSAAGGSVRFIYVDDAQCEGLPTRGFTGKATWYRIFLPDLLPNLDRVLVLDADVIVTDSLAALWSTRLDDVFLAAVTNVLAPQYIQRPAELGISPHAYFNAGVMLLNLDLMRREGCVEQIRAFGVEHAAELALRDQDALNAILARRRAPLHPRWNYMNAFDVYPWTAYVFGSGELEEARSRPAIRHFEGPGQNKPWHADCTHELREIYHAHRVQTPWPEYRPLRASARERLSRQLGAVRRRLYNRHR
jgi:lipopolysaccharide biosynthesis glycosyltransferase